MCEGVRSDVERTVADRHLSSCKGHVIHQCDRRSTAGRSPDLQNVWRPWAGTRDRLRTGREALIEAEKEILTGDVADLTIINKVRPVKIKSRGSGRRSCRRQLAVDRQIVIYGEPGKIHGKGSTRVDNKRPTYQVRRTGNHDRAGTDPQGRRKIRIID